MKIEVNPQTKSTVKLTVELPPEEMKPHLEKAAEALSQEHKIEGFRPGKASLGIVIQKLGAQAVWEAAAELAVRKTYVTAIKRENIKTIGAPKISVSKLAPDNPFIYHAEVAVLPEIKLGDHKNLKVKKPEVKVTPEQIKKAVSDLQQMFAEEKPVDRPAAKNDKLEIDFDLKVDNVPVEGGTSKNHPMVLGSGQFIPGFEDQLIGMKKGDTKEFDLDFPGKYHNPKVAGKSGHFTVKVNGVWQVDLPALDDAFAKKASKFSTLEELRRQIEKNLRTEAENEADRDFERQIVESLVAKTTYGDIPEVLIDSEIGKMLREIQEEIEQRGLKFTDYLQGIKKSVDDLRKEFHQPAIQRVKAALLLRAIATAENITIEKAEIDAEVDQALATYADQPHIRAQIDSEDYRDFARVMLTNRKTVARLKQWASAN